MAVSAEGAAFSRKMRQEGRAGKARGPHGPHVLSQFEGSGLPSIGVFLMPVHSGGL
jgi:hypothetical protein